MSSTERTRQSIAFTTINGRHEKVPMPGSPGELLRDRRHALGLFMQDIADRLAVSKATVGNYETNYQPIPPKRIHAVAIAYRISIDDLAARYAVWDAYPGKQRQRNSYVYEQVTPRDQLEYWRSRALVAEDRYHSLLIQVAMLSAINDELRKEQARVF